MGKRQRRKGHDLERLIAKIFREELGFEYCKTTRASSKLLDDCKVDINLTPDPAHLPLLIQVKAGYNKNRPKPDVIFRNMDELLRKHFPKEHPIHDTPMILIHKLDGRGDDKFLMTVKFKDGMNFLKAYFDD